LRTFGNRQRAEVDVGFLAGAANGIDEEGASVAAGGGEREGGG